MEETNLLESAEVKSLSFQELFDRQKTHSSLVAATTAHQRIVKLKKLKAALLQYQEEIRKAMYDTFRKPYIETDYSEILPVTRHIDHVCKNLNQWMEPKRKTTPIEFFGSSSYIHYEPCGVVMIISPWNYAFNLVFDPLVSAIASGNCVIIKPSELSPIASSLTKKIINELFNPDEISVIEGDVQTSTALLKLPFNHIFFTGSPDTGKIVMKAAAHNLTSVTLELGGKSPAIVHEDANIKNAARNIAFGKFLNTGQTCIAPDYVLVHKSVKDLFLKEMTNCIHSFYGNDSASIKKSPDYGRIINDKQYNRIVNYLKDAQSKGYKLITGGDVDHQERYIAPTVISDLAKDCLILNEEIFGPILPVIEYNKLEEAILYVNNKPKPLSFYIFSRSYKIQQTILSKTRAGGTTINDCLLHMFNVHLPFGGVNHSGIGKSRGYYGFQVFSNQRSVLNHKGLITVSKLLGAPYTQLKQSIVNFLLKKM